MKMVVKRTWPVPFRIGCLLCRPFVHFLIIFFERQIATPDTSDTKLLIIKMLVVAETCGQGNTSCSIVLTSTYMECRINTKKIPINLAVRSGQVRSEQVRQDRAGAKKRIGQERPSGPACPPSRHGAAEITPSRNNRTSKLRTTIFFCWLLDRQRSWKRCDQSTYLDRIENASFFFFLHSLH